VVEDEAVHDRLLAADVLARMAAEREAEKRRKAQARGELAGVGGR
jgi:hypothetical protein